ncbi:MAG: F0F1 ATP synthase subunit alpha, partial [Myxococcota bacterium]
DVGLSVSRVGGRTQPPLLSALAGRLRLAYAQFVELEVFTRFGATTDERTRATITHGRRIRAALVQAQGDPLSLGEEVGLLVALSERLFDAVPEEAVPKAIAAVRQAARAKLGDLHADAPLDDAGRAAVAAVVKAAIPAGNA